MELKLYNTLSRTKETFTPLEKIVRTYTCGPTVYNYAHIGNLRTYVFMDILRRVLLFNGYKLKSVLNITNVGHLVSDADAGEDKLEKAARTQKKTPDEIADFYTEAFFKDINRLNILLPEVIAKATDHIGDMLAMVEALLARDYAYETQDGIYFDISKFSGYGKLSRMNFDEQVAGARVDVNTGKRHPADFALWKKAAPNHIMQWDSPWGRSFPGWHIECSAMALKYLGERFDIHTGGIDHVPIHHENEIAQTEAYLGHKSVNYWMHSEFMLVDNGKMSKSLGNIYTIDDLAKKGYSAMDFRYFCLNAQYRQKLNFTWESLKAAKTAHERLIAQLVAHKNSEAKTDKETIEKFAEEFHETVNDDLNAPKAMGVLWTAVKLPPSIDIYNLALETDRVFGLQFKESCEAFGKEVTDAAVPAEVLKLVEQRLAARKERDFAKSDELRAEIAKLGYAVKDVAGGFEIEKIKA